MDSWSLLAIVGGCEGEEVDCLFRCCLMTLPLFSHQTLETDRVLSLLSLAEVCEGCLAASTGSKMKTHLVRVPLSLEDWWDCGSRDCRACRASVEAASDLMSYLNTAPPPSSPLNVSRTRRIAINHMSRCLDVQTSGLPPATGPLATGLFVSGEDEMWRLKR